MNLFELARQTGADCALSDGEIEIKAASGLDDAQPGEVTFLSNPKYANKVASTRASAIYITENAEIARDDIALLRAKDPYLAFTRALVAFHPRSDFVAYWDPTAVIDSSTRVPKEIFIDAHVAIGKNVVLGNRVRIQANATIYDNVIIGDDTEIHSG